MDVPCRARGEGRFPVRSMVSPFHRGIREICRRACKPNSVVCGHSSRRRVTADTHQRPTRRFPLRRLAPPQGPRGRAGPARDCRRLGQPAVSLPIWSCSVWGLPCLRPYSRSGALLPHLFTLTLALARWRYLLCGTSRPGALTRRSRTLSGTLPCGVRTFLSRTTSAGSGRPAHLQFVFYGTDETSTV